MVMPPIRITGAISAMTAEKLKVPVERQQRGQRAKAPVHRQRPAATSSQTRHREGPARPRFPPQRFAQLGQRKAASPKPQPLLAGEKATVTIISKRHHDARHDAGQNSAPIETLAIMP
jgi:hypothetical protein